MDEIEIRPSVFLPKGVGCLPIDYAIDMWVVLAWSEPSKKNPELYQDWILSMGELTRYAKSAMLSVAVQKAISASYGI